MRYFLQIRQIFGNTTLLIFEHFFAGWPMDSVTNFCYVLKKGDIFGIEKLTE